METRHNLVYEEELINSLGLKIRKEESKNTWSIQNINGETIGIIKYKVIQTKNKQKGTPQKNGYLTLIKCPTFEFSHIRLENDNPDSKYKFKTIEYENIEYQIEIIDDNELIIKIDNKDIHIYLQASNNSINLNIKINTELSKKELILQLNKKRYFILQKISHLKKEENTILEYEAVKENDEQIRIIKKEWKNDYLITNIDDITKGDIEEIAKNEEAGILIIQEALLSIYRILPYTEERKQKLLNKDLLNMFSQRIKTR